MSSLSEVELNSLFSELMALPLGSTKDDHIKGTLEYLYKAGCLKPKSVGWNIEFPKATAAKRPVQDSTRAPPAKQAKMSASASVPSAKKSAPASKKAPAPAAKKTEKAPSKDDDKVELSTVLLLNKKMSTRLSHPKVHFRMVRYGAMPPAGTKEVLVVSDDLEKAKDYVDCLESTTVPTVLVFGKGIKPEDVPPKMNLVPSEFKLNERIHDLYYRGPNEIL